MKKYMISVIALAAAFALLLTGCGKGEAEDKSLGLKQWELTAAAWSSSNGATVTLKAWPNHYEKGQTASFVVRLEGEDLENEPCEYADGAYTAQVDLNAADGYCYYVVLRSADGQTLEVEVNTPNNPADDGLINMAHALEAYCHMTVNTHVLNGDLLTITDGSAQIRLPEITRDGQPAACVKAELILTYNEAEVGRQALPLAGDISDMVVNSINFTIPQMEEDEQLYLTMEVTLTDGQVLTAPGGAWLYNDGQLVLAVG